MKNSILQNKIAFSNFSFQFEGHLAVSTIEVKFRFSKTVVVSIDQDNILQCIEHANLTYRINS